jgi:2-dehydropantoate 2-reductase
VRVLIIGAGALGGLIGARLTEAGEDVTLLEINHARAQLLNESGLMVGEAHKTERCIRIQVATTLDDFPPADLVIVAVKTYQTRKAIENASTAIGPHTWVLSVQNGVGNVEVIAEHVNPERILTGITFHSIQHTGPNRLRYRMGINPMQIAPFCGHVTDEIQKLESTFGNAGLATNVVNNVDHTVWQKLLHNAVVNPTSALTGLTCDEMLEDADLQHFMREVCNEIVTVMKARGVPIQDEEDPYGPVINSQRALGKNRPSMWQDVVRGLPTEIDAINGGVVAEAQRLGLKAPLNWGLVRMMHALERRARRGTERAARTVDQVKTASARFPIQPVGQTRLRGMPSGRVPLQCAPVLKKIISDYYRDLDDASRDPNRHVAWCSGMAPVEIVRALGYTPYFPENHSAILGASRRAKHYIRRAITDGFSPLVNTEMTADIGAMLAKESPLLALHGMQGIPSPEVLVYSTNFGHFLARWFEYYSHRMGAPVFGLHPVSVLDHIDQHDTNAATQQMLRLVDQLEWNVRHRLNPDKLAEIVLLSATAAGLWSRILDLARESPSPLTYFDAIIHCAPMVMLRGTKEAVTYYETLLAELEQRVAHSVAAVAGERYRFYWEGPPIWCALRSLASMFIDQHIAIVGSTYAANWSFTGLDPNNPIDSLALAYLSVFPNRSREYKVRFLKSELQKYSVDAVVHHDGRTCPEHSNVRYGLHMRLQRDTGIPAILIEADTHDERLVSLDSLERQLIEFNEKSSRDRLSSTPSPQRSL